LEHHDLRGIQVSVQLGPCDDSGIDLVVKAQNIQLGAAPSGNIDSRDSFGGLGISMKEATNAEIVRHWPSVTIQDPERRKVVYRAARDALNAAEAANVSSVGFFTLGLEVSRVPSWEVAEEIVKAVFDHAKEGTGLGRIVLVASSPIQVSSFQYALGNINMLRDRST
jgi:acyl-CoA hydrolase